ncbi:hypothetical protein TCDM_11683 [Trypanosoma cruzi Dm28c]|uniref:Uncharacterized protein n=1 Tax=Trypanosoma cruzi Dm28c TaxID=1416333 RepID=V5B8S2_TRYCR|nr:hypothetical protein TCDM_11683 [Trypanosoma cruzi Dm28c]
MSCRHSAPIMSATQNAYWRTFAMRCNHTRISLTVTHCISLSLWLEHLPSSQSTAWCCKRLTRGFTFEWKTTCAETTATLTPSHISTPSIHSPAHKRQQQEGQRK